MKLKPLHLIVSLSITGLMLYFLVVELRSAEMDAEDFLASILGVSRPLFFSYLAISISALFLRALRYQILIKRVDEQAANLTFSSMLIVTSIRNALVDMFPARLGEASFFYILKTYGINFLSAASVFGLCLALDIAVLGVILFLSLSYIFFYGQGMIDFNIDLQTLIFTFATAIVLFSLLYFSEKVLEFLLVAFHKFPWPSFVSPLTNKLSSVGEKVVADLKTVKSSGAYPFVVSLTFLLRLAKYGSLYLLLLAVVAQWGLGREDINLAISSVSFILAEATASLPISGFMGFGAYESAWSIIMKLGGNKIPATLSLALIVHLLTQVVGYTIGLVGAIAFLLPFLRKPNE